jgi:hypothetical protein
LMGRALTTGGTQDCRSCGILGFSKENNFYDK